MRRGLNAGASYRAASLARARVSRLPLPLDNYRNGITGWNPNASAGATPQAAGAQELRNYRVSVGNPRLRTTLIQLAWLWLRHQPKSALALWFEERVKQSGRLRKTTIVALARKLLIALWKYVTLGVVIEGAVMEAA